MKEFKTGRGFHGIDFADANGVSCSVQESSAIGESVAAFDNPGSSFLWVGCNNPNPTILTPGVGWTPFPLPAEVMCTTRMHLSREQVAELVKALRVWLETGTLLQTEGLTNDGR